MLARSTDRKNSLFSISQVGLSLVGLIILTFSTFTLPMATLEFHLQRELVFSTFVAICVLGMLLGLFPSMLSKKSFGRQESDEKKQFQPGTTSGFAGHHPLCGNFSAHILQLGNRTYCAGCSGLVLGAAISINAILLYYFLGYTFRENAKLVFWIGFAAVTSGLLQYCAPKDKRGLTHFSLNVVFVFGAFLILVGVCEVTQSLLLEVYLLTLIVYWIITRIMVSQLGHRKTCASCPQLCGYPWKNLNVYG